MKSAHLQWLDITHRLAYNLKGQGFIKQIMDNQIEVAGQFDQMNKVVEELLKGNTPVQIARRLDMTRVQVTTHIDNWKMMVQDNTAIRERAKEALAGADQHYQLLISSAWATAEDAEEAGQLGVKVASLKLIADIEAKRIDMLNKAGVLEDSSMADKIIESERKQEILVGILRDVTSSCEKCKWQVSSRLSEVTGQVEAVDV